MSDVHVDDRRHRRPGSDICSSASTWGAATKAPIERFRAHAHTRGWRHIRLLSSGGTTYNRDYHAEWSNAGQRPMATVLVRRNGMVHHVWSGELVTAPLDSDQGPRHVDFRWPLWAIRDRTPNGRGNWGPSLAYDGPAT